MNLFNPFPSRVPSVPHAGFFNWLVVIVALFALQETVTSCGGPTVTVENQTKFPVRVIISTGGNSQVLSPSPGESSTADASEGPYGAGVVPDEEWIAYAKEQRKFLLDQFANYENLTGDQLRDVVARLKDIAARMDAYQKAGQGTGCSGAVTSEHDGLVQVSTGPDGKLVVVCK